jgi:hypothetical protein
MFTSFVANLGLVTCSHLFLGQLIYYFVNEFVVIYGIVGSAKSYSKDNI